MSNQKYKCNDKKSQQSHGKFQEKKRRYEDPNKILDLINRITTNTLNKLAQKQKKGGHNQ